MSKSCNMANMDYMTNVDSFSLWLCWPYLAALMPWRYRSGPARGIVRSTLHRSILSARYCVLDTASHFPYLTLLNMSTLLVEACAAAGKKGKRDFPRILPILLSPRGITRIVFAGVGIKRGLPHMGILPSKQNLY